MTLVASAMTDRAHAQRRAVPTLAGAQVLSGVAVAGSIPAGSLLAASVSGSEAAAGLAQTAGVTGAALLALPLAQLALRRGRRSALATGYGIGALGAVVVIAGAAMGNLPILLIGCLLVGVASAAGYQARYAATDLAEPSSVGRALSIVVWGATVGAVLGPNLIAVDGVLAESLGLPPLAGPYVVALACLGLASLGLWALLRPDPYLLATAHREAAREASAPAEAKPSLRAGLAHLRTRPRAVLGIAVIAVGHVVMVMVMVMTPVHMAHVDVTLQIIGLVISVHVAGMYALSPVVGWSVDRYGRRSVALVGIVILLAACAIAGLAPAHDALILGTGLFLLGLGWSCTLIAGSAMVTDATDPAERPAVQGLSDLTMNVAGALGGALAGVIVLVASYGALCAISAIPLLVLAVPLIRAARVEARSGV